MRSLMRANQLRSVWRRKFIHSIDSKQAMPVPANVLALAVCKGLAQSGLGERSHLYPDQKRLAVSGCGAGPAFAQDCGLGDGPWDACSAGVCRFANGYAQHNLAPGPIAHSDRGLHYTSSRHQALLRKHGLLGSMGRKSSCWDKVVVEHFFLNFKMERVWQKDYANHAEASRDIADYIVHFYNAVRLHSTLGNLSPLDLEHQSATKKPSELFETT